MHMLLWYKKMQESLAHPRSTSNVDQHTREVSKKRKVQEKTRVQMTMRSDPSNGNPIDDGFSWRKYGQKNVLGAKAPNTIGDPGPSTAMGIDILHMPEATTAYLSKATDREILDEIRAAIISEEKMHLFHTEHIHEAQAKTDPTDLKGTVWYVTSRILGHETNHGCWKGKYCEIVFTADNNEQSSGGLDRYIGLKRTLEFRNKGTKTNWLMHEYIPLDQHSDYLFFKDELVLRKVFFRNDKGKGLAAEHNNDKDGYSRDINDEINHRSKIASDGKRCNKQRPLGVWNHFIKIYDKQYDKHPRSDGSNLVYGVCRYCDRVLIATSYNGTTNLMRHILKCTGYLNY